MAEGLHVLFDGYWWFDGPTSNKNVMRSIVRTWAEDHPGDRLTVTAPAARRDELNDVLADHGIRAHVVSVPAYARIHALAAVSTGRMRPTPDVVVTHNFAARTPGAISVCFVHDAMFVEHPEWFLPVERAYLAGIRPLLRRADLVFTSSQTEASRIAEVWPEVAPRLAAVGLHAPRNLIDSAERKPDGVPDGPFVLVVGRLNVRKNLRRMVDAFLRSELSRTRRLLVVGQRDGLGEALTADRDRDRVVFLDRIDDAGLRWLYRNAETLAFPSLDEGFGLPLAEAAMLGTPSIASDIPVFRELDLADDYFDPTSVDDMVRALDRAPRPRARAADQRAGWSDTVMRMRDAVLASSGRLPVAL